MTTAASKKSSDVIASPHNNEKSPSKINIIHFIDDKISPVRKITMQSSMSGIIANIS
jgi:hypothetical protein